MALTPSLGWFLLDYAADEVRENRGTVPQFFPCRKGGRESRFCEGAGGDDIAHHTVNDELQAINDNGDGLLLAKGPEALSAVGCRGLHAVAERSSSLWAK